MTLLIIKGLAAGLFFYHQQKKMPTHLIYQNNQFVIKSEVFTQKKIDFSKGDWKRR